MAKIVCIDTRTLRTNCEIGDVVSVHDDDVELGGKGYENFKIINIVGLNAEQIKQIFHTKTPEVRDVYKPIKKPAKWTFIKPDATDIDQEKIAWKHTDENWYFLEEKPKYSTMTPFSALSIDDLGNITISESIKLQIVQQVGIQKIHLNTANMVIVKELF